MPSLPEEFQAQYDAETRDWLRRRVFWFAATMAVLWGAIICLRPAAMVGMFASPTTALVASTLSGLLKVAACIAVLVYLRRHPGDLPRARLIFLVTALVIALGAVAELAAPFAVVSKVWITQTSDIDAERAARMTAKIQAVMPLFATFIIIFVVHFSASLFIPWTPREALRPLLWLFIIGAIAAMLASSSPLPVRLVFVALMPLAGAPGVLLSWWRLARFRHRFGQSRVAERYGEMKRELVDARRIHEALFPPPITRGPVHLSYRYEPMRQIGGDFLYAFPVPKAPAENTGPLSVVIIDVTGHGVPAALTVSALHGELERLFLTNPASTPGDILSALNRYTNLLLSRHSVYPSALCLRADPATNSLTYASAGHPPAFLVNGSPAPLTVSPSHPITVSSLDPTTFLLGACDPSDFDPQERSLPFRPGDAVLAYTDGASEALNSRGQMLRPEGLRAAIAAAPVPPLSPPTLSNPADAPLATAILAAVTTHRHGPPTDDTLIVELRRAD